jgi:thymidylate synthase (FAD)
MKDRLTSMRIRVFCEETRTFTTSTIMDIRQTGVKPVFDIELYNGKRIKCTKEHKFLTHDGFLPLEQAIGLELRGNTAVIQNPNVELACNGVEVYKSYEWMSAAKERAIQAGMGLKQIADEAGVTTHTVRKWLYRHNLKFTRKEVASYTPIWNKGVTGYSLPNHTIATIKKMRISAKRGAESNLWRGGANRSERLRIADWCAAHRAEFLLNAQHKCNRCSSNKKLELHHIARVVDDPDLAYAKENIEVICKCCHDAEHGLSGERTKWKEKSRGNTLTVRWSKVKYVRYVG